jgi:HSP20 family molecular chaperone IbpA
MQQRPYLTKDMCIRVVQSPIRVELQEQNRYRFWGRVEELPGKFSRVVTLSDKVTIHNAFLDRGVQTLKLNSLN